MKPLSTVALAFALIVALWGCKTPEASPNTPALGVPNTSSAANSSTTSAAAEPPVQLGSKDAEPAVKPADIPSELKTDAYRYYGVENDKPMTFEITKPDGTTVTGTSTNRMKELKDGKLTVAVERTGGLMDLGSEEDSVEKDGIHTLSTSMGTLKSSGALELPAKLDTGATWKSGHEITRPNGTKVSESVTYKVEGKRKVVTKAGAYDDSLLVSMDGTTSAEGTTSRMTGKAWYVLDKGMVKTELSLSKAGPNGKPLSIMIQETK